MHAWVMPVKWCMHVKTASRFVTLILSQSDLTIYLSLPRSSAADANFQGLGFYGKVIRGNAADLLERLQAPRALSFILNVIK